MEMMNPLTVSELNYLDEIFNYKNGFSPIEADKLKDIDINKIKVYCHTRAIYGIATYELIELIKKQILQNQTIEVGAGCGVFGRALNIPMYDNYQQELPGIKMYYTLLRRPTIKYAHDVIKMDALQAIAHKRPAVVFGSWITHKYDDKNPINGGNSLGIDELKMFDYGVKKYIMYGNEYIHYNKPLLKHPSFKVLKIKTNYMYSRNNKGANVLYIITLK